MQEKDCFSNQKETELGKNSMDMKMFWFFEVILEATRMSYP